MTSLATVFGLLPMALGWGVGGETNAPLARAVVGGLSVSTPLTLFLIPTLYLMLEERFGRRHDLEAVETGDGRVALPVSMRSPSYPVPS
jgi:Cu/Ag efflux pump CusA